MNLHLHRFRRPCRRVSAIAALSLAAGLLSGCSLIEGPAPDAPARPTPVQPDTTIALVPGGSAEENLPFFEQTLIDFTTSDLPVEGRPVVDALSAAGFDRAAMQVTMDRTKTDLGADNIFASVLIGTDCLVGQIVTADRTFVAQVMPALGPETNICIIGQTRSIDW
jgi:hypothetical protein